MSENRNRRTLFQGLDRGRLSILLAAAVLSLTVILSGTASASHWQGPMAGYDTDITFDQINLTTGFHDAFHWDVSNNVDRTELNSILYHNSSYTREVRLYDGYYGDTTWAGRAYCEQSEPLGRWCETWVVQYNLTHTADYSTGYKRHLSCHEVGHALGLGHEDSGSSCMRTAATDPNAYDKEYFTSHDINTINSIYPYQ